MCSEPQTVQAATIPHFYRKASLRRFDVKEKKEQQEINS